MQMNTREELGRQPGTFFLDSNPENLVTGDWQELGREQTARVVFHQIRESAIVKIRMLSSAGQKRDPAFGSYESRMRMTDWPVY